MMPRKHSAETARLHRVKSKLNDALTPVVASSLLEGLNRPKSTRSKRQLPITSSLHKVLIKSTLFLLSIITCYHIILIIETRRELGINSDFQNTLRAEEGGNGRSNNLSSFSSTSMMKKKQPSLSHEPGEMSFDSLKYCALTIQMKEQPAKTSASLKQPQFIIDNSVYSQVSANYRAPMASKDVSDEEEADDDETQDEVVSFNKENYESNKNKNEEFTTFKVPQVPPLNPVDNLPVSLRPINNVQPNSEYLFKKNKVGFIIRTI